MAAPMSHGEKGFQIAAHIAVILAALACLIPCLYVVAISLTPYSVLLKHGGYTLFPEAISFEAYRRAFANNALTSAFLVSVARVLVGASLHLAVCSAAGYALSKRYLPGYRVFMTMVLITFLFGPGLIPFYLVARAVRLTNTFWMYVVPSAAGAWSIFVFRQFFMELPPELEEAARLDGASDLDILLRVVLPLSGPVYAALGLFSAVAHWNDYMTAVIYVPKANLQPIANVVQRVLTVLAMGTYERDVVDVTRLDSITRVSRSSERMAVVVLSVLPVILIYPFLQRYFIKGMLTGAIKG
jgi:putative aldouronate transport system permease protein